MDITIITLGKLQILGDGRPLLGLTAVKTQALLIYLAVTRKPHSREALAGLLWGELPDEAARANLRVALSRLRQATGNLVASSWQAIGLNPAASMRVDTVTLEQAASGDDLASWQGAANIYQGDFLAGSYLPDAPVFDEWVTLERERLRQIAADLLGRLIAAAEADSAYAEGIGYARRLLAMDNWREETHRALMRLLALAGQRSEALAQYKVCRRVLAEELGIEPSAETVALYDTIKQDGLRAQGAVTKQVEHPAAPVTTPLPTAGPPNNLPASATSFIGREAELAQLAGLLSQPDCRLVTILGPGGAGKTRLALQAAAAQLQQPHFSDGIYIVPLAALAAPPAGDQLNPIAPAVAEALSLTFHGLLPPESQLLEHLRRKHMLLALDNFDHLVEQAGFVAELLAQAPAVKVLVTSRERLGLYEEWLFDLAGLDYPVEPVSDPDSFSAVQLFTRRARRVFLGFDWPAERDGTVEICRLVEGLPLAIELAAGWVRTIPCQDIARQIAANLELVGTWHNLPERHRSLRAVFDYSWQLLPEPQQAILSRLAIFRGGFSQSAAGTVAGAALRDLSGLVDRSLVQRTPAGRYQLHEVIRHFALAELKEPDRPALAWSHARFYAAFLAGPEPATSQARLREPLDRLAQEFDNVLAVWQWAVEQAAGVDRPGSPDEDALTVLDRLLPTLALFFLRRGRFDEGRNLFAAAAAALEAAGWTTAADRRRPLLLARINQQRAKFLEAVAELDGARALLYPLLTLFEQAGEPALLGDCWEMIGRVERLLGQAATAEQAYQQALTLFRRLGQVERIAGALSNLGILAKDAGRYGEAAARYEEALALFQELNEPSGVTVCLINLGNLANIGHDYGRAGDYYARSYAMAAALGERKQMAISRLNLAEIARLTGDLATAERDYQESLELGRDSGQKLLVTASLDGLGQTMLAAGELDRALGYLREALAAAAASQARGMILTVLASAGRWLVLAGPAKTGSGIELLDQVLAQPGTPHYVKEEIGRFLAAKQRPPVASELSPTPLEAMIARAMPLLAAGATSTTPQPSKPRSI